MPRLNERLGHIAPQLWLLDAMYFNRSSFETVRNLQSHILIKYIPVTSAPDTELFRDVLEDANRLFNAESSAVDPVESEHGFDRQRWYQWSVKKTSAEFAVKWEISINRPAVPVDLLVAMGYGGFRKEVPEIVGNGEKTWS